VSIFLTSIVGFSISAFIRNIEDQFISLSNLVEALNIGDFSLRGKVEKGQSGHSDLIFQLNTLADSLTTARYDFKESQLLLAKVIKQIKVAIIACDENNKLTMVNPETEKLLGMGESKLIHKTLSDLSLTQLQNINSNSIEHLTLGSRNARWHIYKDGFREQGTQHTLYILSDMDLLLNQQEQKAWKDLVRVLSHEINNSLAPIISLTSTLDKMISYTDINNDDKTDVQSGLSIIQDRATSLKRFIQGYRALTHLPEPKKQLIDLVPVIEQLVVLLKYPIKLNLPRQLKMQVDATQIEQCLINLLKNAYEAGGPDNIIELNVSLNNQVLIEILDKGVGIQNSANLFVPLYTTKPEGTGIGLSLCKQIIQAHNGHLQLTNRQSGGCRVEIKLSISP
jgi:PAS domain S-box-containing protein